MRLIDDVTRQITAIQPLPNLFQQIVKLVHDIFDYYLVNIYTIEEPSGDIILGASSTKDYELSLKLVRIKQNEGIIGWVAEHGETALVPDVSDDDRYLFVSGVEDTNSELVVPLSLEGVVLGVLDVQSDKLDDFDKDDMATFELLASQLALAIQEAFTYAAERRQSDRLNALVDAARAVVSILDINKLMDEVVDIINDHFDYDRVHLFLRHENQLVLRSGSGVHSERWLMDNLAYAIDAETGLIPWVAQHAQSVVIQDINEEERYVPGPGLEDTKSEMVVPILMGKHLFGVLDIQNPKVSAFRRQDLMLVEALADSVAIALRNAGLFANEKRRRILSETLREVSTVLGSALDLESVLQRILLGMARVVDYSAAMILLVGDDEEHYRISALNGISVTEDFWKKRIPLDEDISTLVNALLIIPPSDDVDATTTTPLPADTLSVSLHSGDKHIGHLVIKRTAIQLFTQEEKEIITTFANQAALAIMNAQLYMERKEEAWISTALLEVAKATGQAATLEEALETVANITLLLAGVEWCTILLADGDVYRVSQIAGASPEMITKVGDYAIRPSEWQPLQDMIDTGYPIMMTNDAERPADLPLNIDVLQAVLLPLYTKGDILGAMLIGQAMTNDPLTDRKVDLMAGIANQAALAIDGAQLYTAQQEEAWVTTVLLQVAEAVNIQYDLDSTLETIVRLMIMLVGVTRCAIFRYVSAEANFKGLKSAGLKPAADKKVRELVLSIDGDTYLKDLIATKLPLPAGEGKAYDIPARFHEIFDENTAILSIPLIAHNVPVAIMVVDAIDLEGHSGQRKIDILTGVAYQSALAIETARLQEEAIAAQTYEREVELARDIQLSLLPEHPPDINGWQIAAYYRPARIVGGDFYDFIPMSNGNYVLVMADVADKGIPAAMFMTVCRTLIRATSSSQRSAQETLARVNRTLVRDSRSDLFFTCWLGILNPKTGHLIYTSGGHNPPLLVRADGRIEELKIRGMALGIMEPCTLGEAEITLQPGDVLLGYTDGLTEAPRADMVEFGETDLYVNTIKSRHLTAQDLVEKIIRAVDRFTEGQPSFDDLTLFVVKRADKNE